MLEIEVADLPVVPVSVFAVADAIHHDVVEAESDRKAVHGFAHPDSFMRSSANHTETGNYAGSHSAGGR